MKTLLALALFIAPAQAEWLEGKIISVTDGDTLVLLTQDNQEKKIRLLGIDAPESRQPYGSDATKALSRMALDKRARVRTTANDRYGRVLGVVFVRNRNVSIEMLKLGAAWVYRKYEKSESLLALEEIAQMQRRGLWGLPEPDRVPPWEWR